MPKTNFHLDAFHGVSLRSAHDRKSSQSIVILFKGSRLTVKLLDAIKLLCKLEALIHISGANMVQKVA